MGIGHRGIVLAFVYSLLVFAQYLKIIEIFICENVVVKWHQHQRNISWFLLRNKKKFGYLEMMVSELKYANTLLLTSANESTISLFIHRLPSLRLINAHNRDSRTTENKSSRLIVPSQ